MLFTPRLAGDVNGDSKPDLIAGAPDLFGGAIVRVYSGLDGSVLHEIQRRSPSFGRGYTGLGDINSDTFDDFLVTDDSLEWGYAWAFSGRDASILYTVKGEESVPGIGFSCTALNDLDSDGVNDVALGTVQQICIFSGIDGRLLRKTSDCSGFGGLVAVGDVNRDGVEDMIAPVCDLSSSYAHVLSGATLNILDELRSPPCALGSSHSGRFDANGDGFGDFMTTYRCGGEGRVEVLSGHGLWLLGAPWNPEANTKSSLSLAEGTPDDHTLLVLSDFSGLPMNLPIGGVVDFGVDGRRVLEFKVPPQLAGESVTLVGLALTSTGVVTSTPETLVFR